MAFFTRTEQVKEYGETRTVTRTRVGRVVMAAIAGLVAFSVLWGLWFIVPEGHIGVVTRFSKAISQTGPGFNFKTPFIEGVRKIEVREKKSIEKLSAATKNRLPVTATVSINWTVKSESAMRLYIKYGSLEQFESRILDPKLRQATKAAISKFGADQLIRDRNQATAKILEYMAKLLEGYPVVINSPQIENIELPPTYMQAILDKEKAREAAIREEYKLKRQKLEAQRIVQTAEANRDAAKNIADGKAYSVKVEAQAAATAIELKGRAEATAIAAIQDSISKNSLLIEYQKAKQWDGALPTTLMGDGANVLWSLKPSK